MRYTLRAGCYHGGAVRRTPYTKQYENVPSYGYGIFDTEAEQWARPPARRTAALDRELRKLNGLSDLTAAKVRAVLKKAGKEAAHYNRSSMVRGWGSWSSGYRLHSQDDGRILLGYTAHRWSKMMAEDIAKALEEHAEVLEAAGIPVTRENGGLFL